MQRVRFAAFAVVIFAAVAAGRYSNGLAPKSAEPEFASTTIDIGCFVSDPDKSVNFYTEAIGFTEVTGFSVKGDFCKASGLTNGEPLDNIRVLVLGEGPSATRLKLSSVPGMKSKSGDTAFVPSQYGVRYLTLKIADQGAAMERLKKAGIKPIGNAPHAISEDVAPGMFLTNVKDPDGNLIELVGPKK